MTMWAVAPNGDVSTSVVEPAQNSIPVLPTAPAITSTLDGVIVAVGTPDDQDVVGYRAFVGKTPGFPLDATTLRYDGTGNSFTIPLGDDAAYLLRVAPYDAFGFDANSAWAEQAAQRTRQSAVFDITPPEIPTGLAFAGSLTDNGTLTVTYSWTANTESDLAYYDIQVSNGGGFISNLTKTNTFAITGQLPGSSFQAKLRAFDFAGNASAFSPTLSSTGIKDTTPPAAPTSISCTVSLTSAFLTWSNPHDADLQYINVYVGASTDVTAATRLATVNAEPAGPGAFTQSGLAQGSTHYYWISAVDTSGNVSAYDGPAGAYIAGVSQADFTPGLSATLTVSTFSALPASTGSGRLAYVTAEAKTYKDTATGWSKAVDGADLTVGSIQTSAIAADAITASKIGVLGASLFPDGQVQDAAWWATSAIPASAPAYQNPANAFYIDNNPDPGVVGAKGGLTAWVTNGAVVNGITGDVYLVAGAVGGVISGEYYEFKSTMTNTSNRPTFQMVAEWYNASGAYISGAISSSVPTPALGIQTAFQAQAPVGAAYYRLYWHAYNSNAAFTGQLYVGAITVRQANGGSMVIDGTLTASKLVAGTITTDYLAANSITGDKISSSTNLPASLLIGNTGYSLSVLQQGVASGSNGANLLPYSDFPAGTDGFSPGYNPGGAALLAYQTAKLWDKNYLVWQWNAASTATTYSILSNRFVVSGNSVVYIGGYYQASNANIQAVYRAYDNAGNVVQSAQTGFYTGGNPGFPASGASWEQCRYGAFFALPAATATLQLEFYGLPQGAGTSTCYVASPMVITSSAGASVPPNYVPGPNPDAAAIINANQTLIAPGKIQISGGSTLTSLLYGGDNTKIDGGAIAANTIAANKLTIGHRNLNFPALSFQVINGGNAITWPDCYAQWIDGNGNMAQVSIVGATQTLGSGFWYLYWTEGSGAINSTLDSSFATRSDVVCLATWFNPGYMLVQNFGGTIIDGSTITTGSIAADRLSVTYLSAISANLGTITAGYMQSPNGQTAFDLTNSRITFNNGSYMKVMGTGFGSNNQFIEWYGPTQGSVASCTESNAVQYLRTDGSAYFGGALSAGTLTTKAATSDSSTSAVAETSVFGSNGHTIVVTLSYSYGSGQVATYPGTNAGYQNWTSAATSNGATITDNGFTSANGSGSDPGNYTVDLYRSVNGAAYVKVTTLTAAGTWHVNGDAPVTGDQETGRLTFSDTAGGSLTYTDPQQVAQNRQYKAILTGRNPKYTTSPTQNITIICVEQ